MTNTILVGNKKVNGGVPFVGLSPETAAKLSIASKISPEVKAAAMQRRFQKPKKQSSVIGSYLMARGAMQGMKEYRESRDHMRNFMDDLDRMHNAKWYDGILNIFKK